MFFFFPADCSTFVFFETWVFPPFTCPSPPPLPWAWRATLWPAGSKGATCFPTRFKGVRTSSSSTLSLMIMPCDGVFTPTEAGSRVRPPLPSTRSFAEHSPPSQTTLTFFPSRTPSPRAQCFFFSRCSAIALTARRSSARSSLELTGREAPAATCFSTISSLSGGESSGVYPASRPIPLGRPSNFSRSGCPPKTDGPHPSFTGFHLKRQRFHPPCSFTFYWAISSVWPFSSTT